MTIALLREPGSIQTCVNNTIEEMNQLRIPSKKQSDVPTLKLKQIEQVGTAQVIYYIDEKELGFAYSDESDSLYLCSRPTRMQNTTPENGFIARRVDLFDITEDDASRIKRQLSLKLNQAVNLKKELVPKVSSVKILLRDSIMTSNHDGKVPYHWYN